MQNQAVEGYTTNEAAPLFGVRPNTLRVALNKKGHYFGIEPVKLPNGRLLWPADQVAAVQSGAAK